MQHTSSHIAIQLGEIISFAREQAHYPVSALCADSQMSTKTYYRI